MLLIALIERLCLAPFEQSSQAYLAGLSAPIAPILFCVLAHHTLQGPFSPQPFTAGIQQGDLLGPLSLFCFALTVQPIAMRIKRELPNLLCNVWYLDDVTICGSPQNLAAALKIIEKDILRRGCKAIGPGSMTQLRSALIIFLALKRASLKRVYNKNKNKYAP